MFCFPEGLDNAAEASVPSGRLSKEGAPFELVDLRAAVLSAPLLRMNVPLSRMFNCVLLKCHNTTSQMSILTRLLADAACAGAVRQKAELLTNNRLRRVRSRGKPQIRTLPDAESNGRAACLSPSTVLDCESSTSSHIQNRRQLSNGALREAAKTCSRGLIHRHALAGTWERLQETRTKCSFRLRSIHEWKRDTKSCRQMNFWSCRSLACA